jgi:hypothetical protein
MKASGSSVIPSVKASETKSSKFGQYDSLVRIEQERRRLVKALDLNKTRIQTGMKVLKAKADKKKETGNYILNPSQATKVLHGYSVEDFRISPTRRKTYKEVKIYNCEDIEPTTIKDPNMKRIREQNLKNIVCKKRIDDLVQQRNVAEAKKKEREFKKLPKLQRRSMPKINVPISMLPDRYVRGELPCTIEHGINGQYLSWVCPLDNLDYEYYLPIFFDGLQCNENPAKFLARQGIEDLLFASKGFPNRIKACVHSLVRPLRNALSKFDPEILLGVLIALQQLVTCNEGIGEVLMPYSKQFLAPIATFMDLNKNLGDSIDYAQRKNDDIGENVRKTLELLEEKGGRDAYKQIKFSIPLYESVLNSKVVTHGS